MFLVVDGHPAHKANAVKEFIKELAGRLELHFLPPYAPDLNPDEFVWHYVKQNGLRKRPLRKNESLRERIENDLANVKKDRSLLKSLFRGKSVAYAEDYVVGPPLPITPGAAGAIESGPKWPTRQQPRRPSSRGRVSTGQ